MTDQRRQYSRITFHTPAYLSVGENLFMVEVIDISLKGALIELPAGTSLNTGEICRLDFSLDDMLEHICMQARIAHTQGARAGILCQTIDLDSITHLRRLVELNLGAPELLERELSALVGE